jgi:AraC-like DNA-binding protein
MTFKTNETHGFISAYTFTVVQKGWLTIIYNGKEVTLNPNDLYLYSPGLSVSVLSASHDYQGICLLVDEHTTFESPTVHDLLQIAYVPLVQLHEPKMTLPQESALILTNKMREIIGYLHSDHIYKHEILKMLYAIFLLELQNTLKKAIPHKTVPQRTEDIFIDFIRMLPLHFTEHHDIAFYASSLNISSVYLSRVVRQVMGRTVIDYINQMLIMEASFLLSNSKLSIAQISDRLHFSEPAAFSRFFTRTKGISPRIYRKKRTSLYK